MHIAQQFTILIDQHFKPIDVSLFCCFLLTPLYYENDIVKFDVMIKLKTAKFILDFDKNKLPNYFNNYFCKTS